jgi:hypothetical protein
MVPLKVTTLLIVVASQIPKIGDDLPAVLAGRSVLPRVPSARTARITASAPTWTSASSVGLLPRGEGQAVWRTRQTSLAPFTVNSP